MSQFVGSATETPPGGRPACWRMHKRWAAVDRAQTMGRLESVERTLGIGE
jgi:hypothetical protein